MNWLDWLLLGALILSAFAGMRVGLFWSMAAFGSLLVGWYFAGNVSNAASQAVEVWTDSTTVQATVTVLIYVALMAIMLYAASRAIAALKPILSTTTLGVSTAIDRVGGLALGFLVGAMVLGAVVLVAARLTYQIDLDVIDDSVPGELHGRSRMPRPCTRTWSASSASRRWWGRSSGCRRRCRATRWGWRPPIMGSR